MKFKALCSSLLLGSLLLAACNAPAPIDEAMPAAPEPGEEEMDIDYNDDDMMLPEEDSMEDETSDMDEKMLDASFPNRIVMTNVSEDDPDAQGEGFYGHMDGETRVYATMMAKDPGDGYFYEGWLVCGGEVFTTNEMTFFDGLYENVFVSTELPEVCEVYVITIEPDDGDPAPAGHVLDGVMEGIAHTEDSLNWDAEMFELAM